MAWRTQDRKLPGSAFRKTFLMVSIEQGEGEFMLHKLAVFASLLFLVFILTKPAHTQPEEVADFQLSLFGYRLGMSYEEAASVRPFHRVENVSATNGKGSVFRGQVDSLLVDGVEVQLTVDFRKDRIAKVVGHFPPAMLEDMSTRFRETFGEARDESKTLTGAEGEVIKLTNLEWNFPGADLNLVGNTANSRYATASLLTRTPQVVTQARAE